MHTLITLVRDEEKYAYICAGIRLKNLRNPVFFLSLWQIQSLERKEISFSTQATRIGEFLYK